MSERRLGSIRTMIRGTLRRFGYDIAAYNPDHVPEDVDLQLEESESGIFAQVEPYTMTSLANISALCAAIRYVHQHEIPGAVLECGVWRGGSAMAAAYQLQQLGADDRDIYLCDTFDGLPVPGEFDVARGDLSAEDALKVHEDDTGKWCRSPIDEVRANMARTGYPSNRIHYVEGMVEETLPQAAPEQISVLRLDTDFYESTRHELIHLFPRLSVGGVLIIDDYGYWQGARKATDEYLRETGTPLLLCRIDHGARIAVKVAPTTEPP